MKMTYYLIVYGGHSKILTYVIEVNSKKNNSKKPTNGIIFGNILSL